MDIAFRDAARTKDSVLFVRKEWSETAGGRMVRNTESDFPAVATFYATRHDYMRIAIAMLEAWKSDSCMGDYLKTILRNGYRKGQKQGKPRKPTDYLTTNFRSYAGFFHTEYHEMRKRNLIQMHGYGGQHIWIDFDSSRIVSVKAIHANYNWKKIIAGVMKSGKIKKGNWN